MTDLETILEAEQAKQESLEKRRALDGGLWDTILERWVSNNEL